MKDRIEWHAILSYPILSYPILQKNKVSLKETENSQSV